MKISFAFISDLIFSAFSSFLLFNVFLNYFLSKTPRIVISVSLSLLFSISVFAILKKKNAKRYLSNKENAEYENTMMQLSVMSNAKTQLLFSEVYKNLSLSPIKRKDGLYLSQTKQRLFFFFNSDKPDKTQLVKIYANLKGNSTALIFAESFSEETREFAKRLSDKLSLVCGMETYALLKKTNVFPENKVSLPVEKKNKIKLKNLLNKKHALKYLFFGVIFLFSSYFVKYKIYYLTFGTAFLILAVYLKLFGKEVTD